MKFNVSSSKLFSQLQAVSRVINNKNALPILDDVLFDLIGNELKLTASDGETTIRTTIEVEGAEGAGKVASAAKLLLETLKEFSEQPLAFTIDENNYAVSMVSQNGTYSFVGVNGNEYPEMPGTEADARQIASTSSCRAGPRGMCGRLSRVRWRPWAPVQPLSLIISPSSPPVHGNPPCSLSSFPSWCCWLSWAESRKASRMSPKCSCLYWWC